MGIDEKIQVVKERDEALNARDWDRAFETYAESVVAHVPGVEEPLKGVEAVKGWMTPFFEAFGDLKANIVNSFGQGDWVVVEEELTGTHTGTLVNPDGSEIPPTNKTIKMWSADVVKVENGKITEQRSYFDNLGFMAQLGLLPENE
ncbi:MAG: ester cyclase [Candidatus Thermoplasmatota archaeon]|nr:ester cyclase [Candidatus Thermoplasmatota archaeon]